MSSHQTKDLYFIENKNYANLFSYLLKQIHRGFRVLMQEVVKDQQNASQVKWHGLKLGVYVGGHLSNGLCAESEDSASALF